MDCVSSLACFGVLLLGIERSVWTESGASVLVLACEMILGCGTVKKG